MARNRIHDLWNTRDFSEVQEKEGRNGDGLSDSSFIEGFRYSPLS